MELEAKNAYYNFTRAQWDCSDWIINEIDLYKRYLQCP